MSNYFDLLFLVVMDKAIASFNQRFQQMNDFHEKFGFLFEIVKHRVTDAETNDSALRTQCLNLQTLLSSQTECETASSDIDGLALFDELKSDVTQHQYYSRRHRFFT